MDTSLVFHNKSFVRAEVFYFFSIYSDFAHSLHSEISYLKFLTLSKATVL